MNYLSIFFIAASFILVFQVKNIYKQVNSNNQQLNIINKQLNQLDIALNKAFPSKEKGI